MINLKPCLVCLIIMVSYSITFAQSQKIEIDTTTVSKKETALGIKFEQIILGTNVILKGQILDKETNVPIPFATIILKKEEVYRITDKNGYYELTVKKKMAGNASVEISSMGFESYTVLLKNLKNKTYLEPKFEELSEVVVTGYLLPKTILKKAISKKSLNHPVTPFNFFRYSKILVNKNDRNELDIDLITKDYDNGYLSPFAVTNRVEQVKGSNYKKYKHLDELFYYRENAIRYANVLHAKKHKKFKIKFVKQLASEDAGLYIIAFEIDRNKWNYTNRSYPTKYSGRVYIDKESFAIVKVIENWETALIEDEIEKYFQGRKVYKKYVDANKLTIKEESICYYSDILNNGIYYATRFFNRSYYEILNIEDKRENNVFERDSYLFDFELKDVEEIEYEHRKKEQTLLNRVAYDKAFWDSFYKREIIPFMENKH